MPDFWRHTAFREESSVCCTVFVKKIETMKAEIISVGTEILLGEITDTNAAYIASELPSLGIDLYWVTQVGDNRGRLVSILKRAWDRSDLIIVSGGLGPTEDDLTRESIAEMLGEDMEIDSDLEKWLRDLFSRFGYEMPECNLKQANLIPSAKAIPNPRGSAPGWWVKQGGKTLLAMPGPPGEMQRMWAEEIKDELRRSIDSAVIVSRTLKILGLGEAGVDEMISHLLSSSNPSIGVYAKPTGIELRLTAKAETQQAADGMVAPLEAEIRSIFGENIWGTDDEIMEKVVGDLLREKSLTLATMESCTGGLLASVLTDVPGSSAYFKGGLVSYSNEMKIAFGVERDIIDEHGAVSRQVAEAMARAVRDRLGADVGVGLTGIAGPEEIEDKPVGTIYIGVTDGTITRSTHTIFPQHRPRIKRYGATVALSELRRFLIDSQTDSK
ncbi:MAG: competence/damage-inducible protein A [Chloroflexi bacterium]|nr:competence/damage-inducible protein A [Chloroflexota bacterium]